MISLILHPFSILFLTISLYHQFKYRSGLDDDAIASFRVGVEQLETYTRRFKIGWVEIALTVLVGFYYIFLILYLVLDNTGTLISFLIFFVFQQAPAYVLVVNILIGHKSGIGTSKYLFFLGVKWLTNLI